MVHPFSLKKFNELTNVRKLKRAGDTAGSGGATGMKQARLSWQTSKPSSKVNQENFESLVLKFVTDTLSPLSIVEQTSFEELLVSLNPSIVMPSRYMVTTRLEKTKDSVMACVKTAMGQVDWVATTTDCWTAHHRSFLGVTAHWLNKETMKRESAALACRRLTGKHDYQLLGKELCKVHDQFEITEKVIGTTTDNGSNFVKAFSVFGPSEDESEEFQEHVSLSDAFNSGLIDEPDLPSHYRCAAHTLNLIATTDADRAELDSAYKKLSRSTFAKCQALWNKFSRTTAANEIVSKEAGLQLVRPCATRWNSVFNSVARLNRIRHEKGNSAISNICHSLELPR